MGNNQYQDDLIDVYLELDQIFYIAGQQVNGCAYINAKADRPYSHIEIVIVGEQYVYWEEDQYDSNTKKDVNDHAKLQSKENKHGKIVYTNKYHSYKSNLELCDFMGKIIKGQYSFPFTFVLPYMMAGSFYYGASNYIRYQIAAKIAHNRSPERSQRYFLPLNIVEPARVSPDPIRLQKALIPRTCLTSFKSEKKLEMVLLTPFVSSGEDFKLQYQYGEDQQLTLKVKLLQKRTLISKQRNAKTKIDKTYILNSKKFPTGTPISFKVPAQITQATAIGSITSFYYVITVEVIGGCCSSVNFGSIEFHLIINVKQPTVSPHTKIAPPKKWSPFVYSHVYCKQMRPFRQKLSTKMPYYNINKQSNPQNMIVSGFIPSYKPNSRQQKKASQKNSIRYLAQQKNNEDISQDESTDRRMLEIKERINQKQQDKKPQNRQEQQKSQFTDLSKKQQQVKLRRRQSRFSRGMGIQ